MPETKNVTLIWREYNGPGQKRYRAAEVTYPADCMLKFESDQGALAVRRQSSGEVVAAWRNLYAFVSDGVTVVGRGVPDDQWPESATDDA